VHRAPLAAAGLLVAISLGCSHREAADAGVPAEAVSSAVPSSVAAAAPAASSSVSAATLSAPAAPPKKLVTRMTVPDKGPFRVIDMHIDTPWKVHFKKRPLSLPEGHATAELMRAGHYAAVIYPIYIPDYIHDNNPTIRDADAIYDTIDKLVAAQPTFQYALLGPVPAEKLGVFVSIEGAGAFAADISQIDRFIKRGVRLVGPVHAHDNRLATSATGKGRYGLTDLGKRFCKRIYAAGALVDASHMSDRALADLVPIAKAAAAPIVATHSNARKLRGHPRNFTDEQLRIIGQTGGVVGLNLYSNFVKRGRVRMKHVVAMVKHMVDVAGIDHVGIGTDFDGGRPVTPLRNASKLPDLAIALQKAGMSDQDIRKIFAKNVLRVLYWGMDKQGP